MALRKPIIATLGHVDSGKTSLLDQVRKSSIQETEAGGITQCVGCTAIPTETIKEICGNLLKKFKFKLSIPGILTIDTPGHFAFSSIRERGGSISDMAVLVIDLKEGFQPQTHESIKILKSFETPFIVAANKVDLIPGWREQNTLSFFESFSNQRERVKEDLNKKIYEIIAILSENGFRSERLDRVEDFSKEVAIIPTSAKTGEGIAELLAIISGLSQKYLGKRLKSDVKGPAKGTVLEVKEEQGLGTTIDVLIYEGTLKKGDKLVIGGIREPIITQIRALLQPKPLQELRTSARKFDHVEKVISAAGAKISAPNLEEVVAGVPFQAVKNNLERTKKEIQSQVKKVSFETEKSGVILKADSLGALEALMAIFKKKIPIRRASIGKVTHRDIVEAESMIKENPLLGTIFAFRVSLQEEAAKELETKKVKIFKGDVIYKLLEDYEEWKQEKERKLKRKRLERLTWPSKIQLLGPEYVFHTRKPAIVGIKVLVGKLKPNYKLMKKNGEIIGNIEQIQSKNKTLKKIEKGETGAISISGPTVGRQISNREVLYTVISEENLKKWEGEKKNLSKEELETLNKIEKILLGAS